MGSTAILSKQLKERKYRGQMHHRSSVMKGGGGKKQTI